MDIETADSIAILTDHLECGLSVFQMALEDLEERFPPSRQTNALFVAYQYLSVYVAKLHEMTSNPSFATEYKITK